METTSPYTTATAADSVGVKNPDQMPPTMITGMSSAGLRAMVAALKEAKAYNGSVLVAAANDKIRDTIALVGFQSLFPVFDDILEAVDSL